ncbi:MAG: polysaccharide deacetylase family protein [Ignavibacteria bacterium]
MILKKLFLFIFLISAIRFVYPQSHKYLCVTCDDLPYNTKYFRENNTGRYITDKLLKMFKDYNITVLGSVNSGKLFLNNIPDSSEVKILEDWLNEGMVLANHTYAHKNYNNLYFSEFKNDILDGEIILKELLASRGKTLKYFRHPFLFRGDTKTKADSLQAFLDSLGFIVAPVTIDNSDYIFSWAYEKAKYERNDSLAERIGNDYVDYMRDVLKYYENQSSALFGYNIKHILLMHANLLNADYFDKVIGMYKREGYEFITIDEALQDDCYKMQDEFYKRAGISWLHRWAYTAGKRGDFFKGEPVVPDYIESFIKQ